MRPKIYLDNNATTEIAPEVMQSLINELKSGPSNPSSVHSYGQEARNRLTKSRRAIATHFGVKPTEIVFTSGGTESLNILLRGIPLEPKGEILSTSVEHSAVYHTLLDLQKKGQPVSFIPAGLHGALRKDQIEENINAFTRLIVLMAANNETGVKTDIEGVAHIAKERKIPFIVDGVAWIGKEVLHIPDGVSAICFSGHKFHAPKGIGFMILRSQLKLSPLITGGGQEHEKRAGTENLPGILALAEAVNLLEKALPEAEGHMRSLRDYFESSLCSLVQDVMINGDGPRIANTSNLCFHGIEGESLLIALDLAGIAVSHGSACSSGSLEPSRVLLNMGIPKKAANSSIRFSLSRYTTKEEIDYTIDVVENLVKKIRT